MMFLFIEVIRMESKNYAEIMEVSSDNCDQAFM